MTFCAENEYCFMEETNKLLNLGHALYDIGAYIAAGNIFQRVLLIQIVVLGNWHLKTASVRTMLGNVFLSTGQYDEAKRLFTQALNVQEKFDNGVNTELTRSCLGMVYFHQNKFKDALIQLGQALPSLVRVFGEDHSHIL
ncbi:hypothetical protein BC936DRAFT_146775 [Jimgerdemannia flammicorona]|uniref:Uncharacterized protein n=1 Tax=Jimgerdemannia flammicorona TaxID=994334 RepID=A0A433D6V9_9FUNG|nr:hypothetical protein BC936DRAFT_146775 [Jimgerdemannia flammicorona]